MPFPWKKVKNNRISKLVNDHLQNSQKRRDGSSLVVETGFPTSLVDLFIKNREKLKKPSKRKRRSSPITPVADVGDQVISAKTTSSPSPLEPPSPPANTPLSCHSPLQSHVNLPSPTSKDVHEILVVGNVNVAEDESEGFARRVVVVNGGFLIVLKMFFVVVLLLGTKRLAFGITIAACLLFFLEYLRKHVSRPSVKAKRLLRFWRLLRSEEDTCNKNLAMEIEEDDFLRPCGSSLTSSESRRDRIQEIQVVEATDSNEIQCENEITKTNAEDIKEETVVPDESVSEVQEKKRKKSRKAAMKSKIKKFITTKFKFSRKAEKTEAVAKDKDVSIQASVETHQQVNREESESGRRFSSCSTSTQKDEYIPASALSSEVKEKTTRNTKEDSSHNKMQNEPSLRYLVLLCLIILIGLVQSRVIALVLALSCCFLIKLSEPICK